MPKPCLHVDFDKHDADQAVRLVTVWLSETQFRVLNVAGPRASDDSEIYGFVVRALDAGGLTFEKEGCRTLAEAMAALEKGPEEWMQENG